MLQTLNEEKMNAEMMNAEMMMHKRQAPFWTSARLLKPSNMQSHGLLLPRWKKIEHELVEIVEMEVFEMIKDRMI